MCHTTAQNADVAGEPRPSRRAAAVPADHGSGAAGAPRRHLSAEDPLPSVRELAGQLVVNPRTVSQAYRELEREGVIYVRRGQGTFVAPAIRPDRRARPCARGGEARAARGAAQRARRGGAGHDDPESGGRGGGRRLRVRGLRLRPARARKAPREQRSENRAGDYAVATHGLSKRYGRETALDRVDLRVPDGAVYVLVGANGAGKSTMLKVLMNLERADAGTAEVFGLDTVRAGPEVRAQVGYVPERQEHGYRWMTCARLLRHVAAFYPAWDHAYADHLVLRLRRAAWSRKVGGLSKGESRRLQLVLALAHRPPLLLLDEPTDGLDPVVRRRTLSLLAEHLADAPTTVLISTHHIHELESLADHVGVLRDGRLVAQMPREELQRTVRRYRSRCRTDGRRRASCRPPACALQRRARGPVHARGRGARGRSSA